jgi:hypothetical protein
MERGQSIGQSRGAGLQNEWRLDFVNGPIPDGGNGDKTRTARHLLGPEFLAAPGADDDVRLASNDLLRGDDPISGGPSCGAIGKNIDAAGDLDELRNPGNPGNERLVPFLEKDFRAPHKFSRPAARLVGSERQVAGQPLGLFGGPGQGTHHPDHAEDFREGPLIEGMDGEAAADQLGNDVRLSSEKARMRLGFSAR